MREFTQLLCVTMLLPGVGVLGQNKEKLQEAYDCLRRVFPWAYFQPNEVSALFSRQLKSRGIQRFIEPVGDGKLNSDKTAKRLHTKQVTYK